MKEKALEIPDYDIVRSIFKEPVITDEYKINWSAVDREKTQEFLCEEHDFATERVENTLESFEALKSTVAQRSLDQWS